jgi:hypothetical protein
MLGDILMAELTVQMERKRRGAAGAAPLLETAG